MHILNTFLQNTKEENYTSVKYAGIRIVLYV